MFKNGTFSKKPFVSVVTPVYNGEKFLRACIESVLAQNYDNWEYVLVNNQSTDKSLQIMEEYAALDKRIRIHNNQEFLPQMKNLNHAFYQISPESKYCKVVHADDWLFPNCLTEMVEVAEEYPSVGIVSSYRLDEGEVGNTGLRYPSNFNSGREIARDYLFGNSYYFGSPTSLLIRSDLIRKRDKVYDESYIQSDMAACLDMLQESDFGFVHKVLTFTRRHEDSVTNSVAKKNSTFMFGYLKVHLDYAPVFLSEKECRQVVNKRINIFYIQFAQNILLENATKAFKRHSKELESLGHKVSFVKLFKYILREIVLLIFTKIGIDLSWIEDSTESSTDNDSVESDTKEQKSDYPVVNEKIGIGDLQYEEH